MVRSPATAKKLNFASFYSNNSDKTRASGAQKIPDRQSFSSDLSRFDLGVIEVDEAMSPFGTPWFKEPVAAPTVSILHLDKAQEVYKAFGHSSFSFE